MPGKMFRIILSLTVFLFTTLSVEDPQVNDDNFGVKLTAERGGPPENAQFVPIPVVPIPGQLRPAKRPGKGPGPPPPPKQKPSKPKPTKKPKPTRPTKPKPTTTVSVPETVRPVPIRPTTTERPTRPTSTRPPVQVVTTTTPLRPTTMRPIPIVHVSTTPKPPRPTAILPITTRPVPTTEKPITEPPRQPKPATTTPRPAGPVSLVYSTRVFEDDGSYFFDFLAENSVQRAERGFFKVEDGEEFPIHVKIGNYSFTSPEGIMFRVGYVADENGYRATDI